MEIRHLKLIRAVAETKNITKAANTLFLTQSALSHQLKELQLHYNNPIFSRINKEMLPTRVGERLIQTATKVLDEIDTNDLEIRNMLSTDSGVVRISTQCYTFYHWLSPILFTFSKSYPHVEVKIVSEATYHTLNYLKEGKLDVAILHFKPKNGNFQIRELFEDELRLIVSPENELARKKFVKPQDLIDETYINYNIPEGNGVTFSQLFKKNDRMPRRVVKVTLTEAIIQMVKTNLGVAVMANWAVEPYLKAGDVVSIPIHKTGMRRKWYAASLKRNDLPLYIPHFITTVINCRLNSKPASKTRAR